MNHNTRNFKRITGRGDFRFRKLTDVSPPVQVNRQTPKLACGNRPRPLLHIAIRRNNLHQSGTSLMA
jgi:hypothetical protein